MELLGRAGLPPELISAEERLGLLQGLLLALVADVCGQGDSWYILCLLLRTRGALL